MSDIAIGNPADIAASGLRAQSARVSVISANIANADTLRTASGEPYRRREVVLSTDDDGLSGVRGITVAVDRATDFKRVHQPDHPDADADGFVRMPNVDIPMEMIRLVAASRAYQANAAVLKRYGDLVDVSLELLR